MSNLTKKIQNFAFDHKLWKNGAKIVVAVSGGPDSSCLLDVLAKLKDKHGFILQLAHVNYGLRDKDSDKDEDLVREKAKKYQLPVSVFRLTNIGKKGNLESQLREIRYEYFETLRKNLDFDAVAVGHTLNDQAETVLMRILRGAGLQGLAAMRSVNGTIIRPLLGIKREEIMGYLQKNNISFRIDRTNEDAKLTRNRVRHRLIPYLEKNYNPVVVETLASLAENAGIDYDYILDEAAKKCAFAVKKKDGIEWTLGDFSALPFSLKRECLRRFTASLLGTACDIGAANIREFMKALGSAKNKPQTVFVKDLKLTRRGDRITLSLTK